MGIDRVVVINDDAVARGGAAAVALASARLLRSQGLRVTFLSGEAAGTPELVREGIDVGTLGGQHILQGSRSAAALRGLYDPRPCAALQAWISAHDTPRTVYHLHNWHKVLSPSVFRPLRDVAGRLVISAHDYFLACPNGGYFIYPRQSPCELRPGSLSCIVTACDRRHYGHKLWRVARHWLRQSFFDLADTDALVIAVHETVAQHFIRAGTARQNVRVLRNPVTPWRPDRVVAERNRDVFFVGRLEEDKGADLLAHAAHIAGLRLHIIGDGPIAERLAGAYPDVQQHGWQTHAQIAQLVAGARFLVLPTRCRETFGLVALEALLSGIPVIVSRFAAIAAEVVGYGFGAVCDPYDPVALAALLRAFANDDRRIEQMSRRAFAEARVIAPTPNDWCDGLLQLYTERLGECGRHSSDLGRTRSSAHEPGSAGATSLGLSETR